MMPDKYHLYVRVCHWLLAVFIFAALALGYYLVTLDYYHPDSQQVLHGHRFVGIGALVLGGLLVATHFVFIRPDLSHGLAIWEKGIAKSVHFCLFILILIVPVTGMLYSQGNGREIPLGSVLAIPAFFPLNDRQLLIMEKVHQYSAWFLTALVALHALAALKHHFWDKNDTLRKML